MNTYTIIRNVLLLTVVLYWGVSIVLVCVGEPKKAALWFLYGLTNVVLLWAGMGGK